MKSYGDRIASAIADTSSSSADPRIVECWMRLEHGTLDGLHPRQCDDCARNYAKMVIEYPKEARGLAESYGVKVGGAA